MTPPADRNGRPWWATFVVNVGVPAAICLFLVYWLTATMHGRIAALERITGETLAMMNQASKSMHEFAVTQAQKEADRERLLRQICINTAKGDAAAQCGR